MESFMIRKFLASTAFAALATTSMAADLPNMKGPASAPYYAPAPVFTWTGFYVGLNAGGAFADTRGCSAFFPSIGGVPVAGFPNNCSNGGNGNNNSVSFTGGAQVGYNVQFNSIVLGLEADINGLSNGRNRNNNGNIAYPYTGSNHPYDGSYVFGGRNNNSNYFGTVRARLGYAADRTLFYVTGGLAYGGGGNSANSVSFYHNQVAPFGGAPSAIFSNGGNNSSNSNIGYAVGGGIEYALTNNWTIKGEYLYVNTSRNRRGGVYSCADVAAGTCASFSGVGATFSDSRRNTNGINVVRMGVNYKF
jgi:outer membrane immunogenic protein